MTDREGMADEFLAGAGWAGAARKPLAADVSARRYARLVDPADGRRALLMDAPPGPDSNAEAFVRVAGYLREIGLSVPEIHAQDCGNGFLLIEDFGDDLFARALTRQPDMERPLYECATDVLLALYDAPPPDLPDFGPPELTDLAMVALSEYAGRISGPVDPAVSERFSGRFEDVMHRTLKGPRILAHRDFHAENLIWLPERQGLRRVGLLDFQDAILAHPAYDLVLFLQDVRRPPGTGTAMAMLDRYIAGTGLDDHGFRTAYAVLGAQRALRILGIFARLAAVSGKRRYLRMIPGVWSGLTRSLDHPALAPVTELLADLLPPPTPENLGRLVR